MFIEEKAKGEVKELDAISILLLRTANVIEERGLSDGPFDAEGGACVIMSMRCLPEATEAMTEMALARIRKHLEPGYWGIPSWSDKAAREGRVAEVISTMRVVAFSH
jgi:hypothetical protein